MPTNMRSRVPPAARRLSVNSTSTSNKQVLRKTRQRSIDNQLRLNFNKLNVFYTNPNLINQNKDLISIRREIDGIPQSEFWKK